MLNLDIFPFDVMIGLQLHDISVDCPRDALSRVAARSAVHSTRFDRLGGVLISQRDIIIRVQGCVW